jgi:oligoribonuclease (3'-5' exoribonuclease)
VETVLHNTSLKDRTSVRLVERVTAIPDLHRKQIAEFKLFAREQGGTLINTMNDWLESRRGENKPRQRSTTDYFTAGLHVFAFIEKNGR